MRKDIWVCKDETKKKKRNIGEENRREQSLSRCYVTKSPYNRYLGKVKSNRTERCKVIGERKEKREKGESKRGGER